MLTAISQLLRFVFPAHCVACRKGEDWLCKSCESKIIRNSYQVCPITLERSVQGKVLDASQSSLDALLVYAPYEGNKVLQKLLHRLKYYFSFDVALILGSMFKRLLALESVHLHDYIIVPVPLHWRRLLERGFNQSALMASALGKYQSLLKRRRYTSQQAKLSRSDRLKNLEDVFVFQGSVVPKKVLLLDDVASTMSTMNECAKALKIAGVSEVVGMVIARNI